MEDEKLHDWDLFAVVRGCAASAAAATSSSASSTTTASSSSAAVAVQQDFNISSPYLGGLLQPKRETASKQDLQDLCKPFFHSRPPEITRLPPRQQPFSLLNLSSKPHKSTTPRNKKRKVNMKKVRHVAAEELSSDVWSWRKYGQKPIKGSPYPRGYYRCSTSKGCMARKQVERNRTDPGMFILTYTGDHNHPIPAHRNTSAAGSGIHHKPAEEAPVVEDSTTNKPLKKEPDTCRPDDNKEDGDDFSPLDDDFFDGLEGFATGECSSMDDCPAEFPATSSGGS